MLTESAIASADRTVRLLEGVPFTADQSFTIRCSATGDHVFQFSNVLGTGDQHLIDTNTSNNTNAVQVTFSASHGRLVETSLREALEPDGVAVLEIRVDKVVNTADR